MKTIVFGATGLCGKHITKEVLKKGIQVTAYQRQINTLAETDGLNFIEGTLEDENKIIQAIQDADVIVSAVGNRNYEDTTQVVTPFVKLVCKHITPAQRFIVVAGSGLTLFDYRTLRRDLAGQPPFLANQRADHWDAYCHLAPLDVDYLAVCPTMMIEGDADGNYVFGDRYFPASENKQVFAGNVAHFIAGEIVGQQFKQTRIGIVNK